MMSNQAPSPQQQSTNATVAQDQTLPGSYGSICQPLVPGTIEHQWRQSGQYAQAPKPIPGFAAPDPSYQTKAVIGHDDRIRINNPAAYPYSTICALRMFTRSGKELAGTGFMVGPRLLLTAGHNVYDHEHGYGMMQRIDVYPCLNGSLINPPIPPVRLTQTNFHTIPEWVNNGGNNPDYDYAAMFLPHNVLGTQLGWLACAKLFNATLQGLLVGNAGYPIDCPAQATLCPTHGTTMWFSCGNITNVSPNTFRHNIDTNHGSSGSPVFANLTSNQLSETVVGIHTNGYPAYNVATRITDLVFVNIQRWLAESS